MPDALEIKFHEAMMTIYQRAKEEENFIASRFLQMVSNEGGLQTARTLINSANPSDGYSKLWELGRLDLSVEAVVVQSSKFHSLFTEHELEICKKRLSDFGYEY